MKTPAIALLFALPTYLFGTSGTIQEQADKYATPLPVGGIVIHQTEDGASQLGTAGSISNKQSEPPTIHSVFEIGSITKVFTGLLLAESVRHKKVSLEDTVTQHLPTHIKLTPKNPLHKTTLLQLSTHTSGLPRLPDDLFTSAGVDQENPYAHYSIDLLYRYLTTLNDTELKPGKIAYSNLGVGLLGQLLANAWGTSYADLLETLICKPLDMKQTTVLNRWADVPPAIQAASVPGHIGKKETPHWEFAALAPAGAILSSAADLMRFTEAHWDSNTPSGLKASMKRCQQVHARDGKTQIGLGWFINGNEAGKRLYLHDGATGGFQSVIRLRPHQKFARIELVNQSTGFTNAQRTQPDIQGDVAALQGIWEGLLTVTPKYALRIEIHIEQLSDGKLSCNMYSLDQHQEPIPINTIELNKDSNLHFTVRSVNGSYSGTLQPDGKTLKGEWTQGSTLKLDLKKR